MNKVNSKVHLMLPVSAIGGIREEERVKIRVKLATILNKEDCLFLDVDDERYQERNREIALVRLENRIVQALAVQKKKPKKPTKTSKERKLKLKMCKAVSRPVLNSKP